MKRTATAVWKGNLREGTGTLDTQSGALNAHPYSFKARFEDENGKSGTNPEELLGAAHAGCFTMQLSHLLAEAGHPAEQLKTIATVSVEPKDGGGHVEGSQLDRHLGPRASTIAIHRGAPDVGGGRAKPDALRLFRRNVPTAIRAQASTHQGDVSRFVGELGPC